VYALDLNPGRDAPWIHLNRRPPMTLEFLTLDAAAPAADVDAVIVGVFDDKSLTPAAAALDAASGGAIRRLVESGDVSGKHGATTRLFGITGIAAPRVVLVGLGEPAKLDAGRFRKAAAESAKALKGLPVVRAATFLAEVEVPGRDLAWRARQVAITADAEHYRYTATLSKKNGDEPSLGTLFVAAPGCEAVLADAAAIAAGVRFARELGNLPPNICNPAYIAEQAQRLPAELPSVSCEVLDVEAMRALGMGALLAVGQGSANPPRLVVLRYNGAGDAKPYALVGKGITFDTGGINLKVQGGIEEMKFDMCGAASVLGAFVAAAKLALPINLVCVVAAVENMPDGKSYRPSDVLTTMSGKTVEVLNTDAEGRLILCDALTYVQRFEPVATVDVATLTGACVVALGKHAHGLFSKHDDLAAELLEAGETAMDRAWRLPLWDDYQSALESVVADFTNLGGKWGGAITAACFLARFTEGQRWAHLDIAGTAWEEGRKGLATGRPVGLLTQWLMARAGRA
jgi:leucyl aminopeptidase